MTPLRQRMLEDMSICNLTNNIQLSYLQQVGLFVKYFHRSPEKLGPKEVREYQVYLTLTRILSASSIGTATSALRFLYRVTIKQNWSPDDIPMPKKPFKLPVALSPEEMMHFIGLYRYLDLVGCWCCSHRNRRRIADGQVDGSNVRNGASSSGGRVTLVGLLEPVTVGGS